MKRFPRVPGGALAVLIALAWLLPAAPSARAHELTITDALMVLRGDGRISVEMICDLDALALGVPRSADDRQLAVALAELDSAERDRRRQALRRLLARRVKVRVDGAILPLRITFPDEGRSTAAVDGDDPSPSYFGLLARFDGRLPEAAEAVTFMASRAFPPAQLTILDQRSLGGRREMLLQGAASEPYPLAPGAEAAQANQPQGVFGRYLVLGFVHILPSGLDHVLFVLGLFFFGLALRPLLLQVTAFTIAHTVTLALASLGIARLEASIVEPLIALSIAWVAIENLVFGGRGHDRRLGWRTLVVFAFGLLHGLGFAGVLGELGLPQGALVPALLAFNIGVELGQLAVLALAFAAVGWARQRPFFPSMIARPASVVIAGFGLWWFVERLL